MIKEIKITNFYSFSEETITLQGDVNILIGINGSGKSNFLKAIRLLQEGISGKGLRAHILEKMGGFDNVFFKGEKNGSENSIELRYVFDGTVISNNNYGFRFTDELIYTIKIIKSPSLQNYYVVERLESKKEGKENGFVYLDFTNGVGVLNERIDAASTKTALVRYHDLNPQELVLREVSDPDRYFALTTIRKAIRDISVYDYFDTTPGSAIRKATLATADVRLNADGTNLPQILNTIKINHKGEYRSIIGRLEEVNANFTGFDFNFISGNSSVELMLEERELKSSIHVTNISDGTLRYLCLMAILYNPHKGNFICIDEPEVGLHPDMLRSVANAIKHAAKESTIIVSTHSVGLLDNFSLENVRVFEKDETNATKVITYKEEQFKGWYQDFSLGKMWMSGDFGGVRYGG